MSWYETKEEAEKACLRKEKEFREKFVVVKDTNTDFPCWWANRVSKHEFEK